MNKYTVEEKYEFLCNHLSLIVGDFRGKDGSLEMRENIWFMFDEVPDSADDAVEQAMSFWRKKLEFKIIEV